MRDGVTVDLGDRAFDVLVALAASAGRTVSKSQLILEAWSGNVVGENALQAQVTALRRAFGPDRDLIVTVSGRGYQFGGELLSAPLPLESGHDAHPLRATLPERTSEPIGREHDLDRLACLLRTQRLVTIVGFGGVGKSFLGCELARLLTPQFASGVQWIDLAAIHSPQAARAAVLEVIGTPDAAGGRTAPVFPAPVEAPERLLFLDGCERWIGLAAELIDATLRRNRATRVLATSRELLRVEGESTYRLGPLDLPSTDMRDTQAVSATPAVRMFLSRLVVSGGSAPSSETGVRAAGAICLALDGIPLAIEMAALRAAGVGVGWVAAHLDRPLAWLTHGSRTAPERQHSMRATLDVSFEALSAPERWALERVSELGQPFSLDEACRLLRSHGVDPADALDRLDSLVGKSLVERVESAGAVGYRLFNLTRGYAQGMHSPRA